ncbi:hypothetical protein [Kribbella soli]|uniref:Uncharacterized protein n=1 Tax=Kribbella soli TaxID=1124743 RepID=A0A4R0H944_9ACTN|nr:hypothetical protein [Kribbella soli]TCC05974.1 hypothetical protein E0H45_28730 [Kribbella soli]
MLRIETFAPARRGTAPSTSSLRRWTISPTLSAVMFVAFAGLGAALKVVDIASKWVAIAAFVFCRLRWVVFSPVAIAKQPADAGPATTAAGRAVAVRGAFLRSRARP